MALIIVTILLFSYVILGTETITKVNKAAVAMFAGTIGWVLYICYGTDFVMNIHAKEYLSFLAGSEATSSNVKMFIADHIFLKYVLFDNVLPLTNHLLHSDSTYCLFACLI